MDRKKRIKHLKEIASEDYGDYETTWYLNNYNQNELSKIVSDGLGFIVRVAGWLDINVVSDRKFTDEDKKKIDSILSSKFKDDYYEK